MNGLKMISYENNIENYRKLDGIVDKLLTGSLKEADIHTMQISHRVKTYESASVKMSRKPDKYSSVLDMTDIVGFRVICYFKDQIDQISEIIEKLFDIDINNCVDKAKILSPNAFGYLSVHYICSLKPSDDYPEELCKYRFEIQIRTVLQHTWAEIEHDLGYKNEFGVPLHIRREFSRMASLLEVADDGFYRIKKELEIYRENIIEILKNGEVSGVPIDTLTLREFMLYNDDYNNLINDIASISDARLMKINADPYIAQLQFLGINDLGALVDSIKQNRDIIMQMARSFLLDSEIDELVTSVGLFFICRAILIKGNYSEDELSNYFSLLSNKPDKIEKMVTHLLKLRKRYLD